MSGQAAAVVIGSVIAFFTLLLVLTSITSADAQHPTIRAGNWLRVDLHARLEAEVRRSDTVAPHEDEDAGFDVARRRVGVEGVVARMLDYEIEYEFGGREWRDAYLNFRPHKAIQLKAGRFKVPFGLEANTSGASLDFIHRSRISARLAPGRDRGLTLHGKVWKSRLSYEVGAFRQDGENALPSRSSRVSGSRTLAVRAVSYPFRDAHKSFGELRLGAAMTRTELPLGFPAVRARTVFGASFFDSDVWVLGRRQRSGLELRWRLSRLVLQSEYIRLSDERRGQRVDDGDLPPLVADGWYVSATYRVTRKGARFGDIDVATRRERLKFGNTGAEDTLSTSARAEAVLGNAHDTLTLGVNWRVVRWFRVQTNVIRESILRPAMGPLPDRPTFWSRALRLQFVI